MAFDLQSSLARPRQQNHAASNASAILISSKSPSDMPSRIMQATFYLASWTALMVSPRSQWSTSVFGFMAPAYTPILWLGGIALVGDEFVLSNASLQPWIYVSLAAAFLVFHNLHAGLVYSRVHHARSPM
jgi:hypothetical protein